MMRLGMNIGFVGVELVWFRFGNDVDGDLVR
jgi:hypothetical protein